MIISTDADLELNKRYEGWTSDVNLKWQYHPFLVLRVASKEDYMNQCKEYNVEDKVHHESLGEFYYEVSVD